MKDKLKKFFPHIAAIIFFLGLSLIYFSPVVFENKTLHQGDLENMTGWGKDLIDYHKETGDYAFWSNSMFSGMPANFTYMPPFTNIFDHISRVFIFNLPINHIGIVFIYLLGFYILLMSLGCKPLLSIVGAIAYAFTSYNLIIIEVGHVNKGLVMATMAPIIGGIILCYRKKYLWGIITTLIFTGINVAWGHQQISYYLILMIIILAIVYLVYAIKEKTLKDYFISSGILVVVATLGLAPSMGFLLSTADYAKDTMRGGSELQNRTETIEKKSSGLDIDYAFYWSYGKAETMTLLIPNFYGGRDKYDIGINSEYFELYKKYASAAQATQQSKNAPMYWGDQPGTASPYAGAIICFLFLLGLFIVKGPEKWWLLGATILSIVLAWGKNFGLNEFIFYHLPLYNKFRTPTMALSIAEVTMVTLAILALKDIFDNKENRKIYLKSIYISAGITGGLCLFFALLGSSLMTFSGYIDSAYQLPQELVTALVADRKSLLIADSWRSLAFIALATGALWYYINKKVKTTYLIAIIGILVFTDLWTVGKRHLNFDSFVEIKKTTKTLPTEADNLILQDKDPNYRVYNMTPATFSESATSFFHKSIGGYSPAKLQRYQDIISYYLSGSLNPNILNMLNTKYLITSTQQGQQQVQPNPHVLGNAWFVNELKWVDTPDEEITALNNFDPAQTAYIDKEWQSKLNGWEALQHEKDSTASIRLTDYANPGNLFYESNSTMPHLAVFSEVHYKTWHAYIDGKEAPVIRVNYILRGLEVPAGNHKIEFKCVDDIYLRGAMISKVSSTIVGIVIFCLLGFAIWTSLKRKREKAPESPLITTGKTS